MDVLLLGMEKTITAGASRIYRSLALSSNGLAESYAKALEYNGVAISAACPLLAQSGRHAPLNQCPLLAQSGHHAAEFQCPLLGVKQTSLGRRGTRRRSSRISFQAALSKKASRRTSPVRQAIWG
jgi:hypothetical protein